MTASLTHFPANATNSRTSPPAPAAPTPHTAPPSTQASPSSSRRSCTPTATKTHVSLSFSLFTAARQHPTTATPLSCSLPLAPSKTPTTAASPPPPPTARHSSPFRQRTGQHPQPTTSLTHRFAKHPQPQSRSQHLPAHKPLTHLHHPPSLVLPLSSSSPNTRSHHASPVNPQQPPPASTHHHNPRPAPFLTARPHTPSHPRNHDRFTRSARTTTNPSPPLRPSLRSPPSSPFRRNSSPNDELLRCRKLQC